MVRRATRSRTQYVEGTVLFHALIGSPAYPAHPDAVRERAQITWDRGISFTGVSRQMVAILTQHDRTKALGRLRIPVSVLHGLDDKMVHVSGGRATARAVPGAELVLVPGMGHDLPAQLFPTFVDTIARTAARVRASRAPTSGHLTGH
jgi:pimeloyl-ACP methyl ester carboxylesterase